MRNFYHISINTCAMIGQLSGPYLTVRLAKFKTLFKLKSSSSIWTRNLTNILVTRFFRAVLLVTISVITEEVFRACISIL